MIGSAIVNTATLQDLTEAVNRLATAIDHGRNRAKLRQTGRLADLLEELSRKIDREHQRPPT